MGEIELRGVGRTYDDFVLQPTSLKLRARSFTVLLGPSGSGKSTLLRVVAGLERPDRGRVLLDGEDVTDVPTERRGVGLVFQDGALFPHLDVTQNVQFGLRVGGVPRAYASRRAEDLLDLVGLVGKGSRRIAKLSGGERQRVALARALATQPRVLLLDEPLAALDRALRDELRGHLRRVHDELGLTTLMVTHDRDEALSLADRLVLMDRGAVVEEGEPRATFRSPRTAFAARLLGSANVLPDGRLVPLDAVRLRGDPRGNAVVEETRFAGFHEEVRVRLDDGTLLETRVPVGQAPKPGARVHAAWQEGEEKDGPSPGSARGQGI